MDKFTEASYALWTAKGTDIEEHYANQYRELFKEIGAPAECLQWTNAQLIEFARDYLVKTQI